MDSTQSLRDFIMKTRSQREKLKLLSNNLEKAIKNRSNSSHISLSKRFLRIMETQEVSSNLNSLIKPSTAQAPFPTYSKSKRIQRNKLTKSPCENPAYKIYNDPPFPLHVARPPSCHPKKRLLSMNQQEISNLEFSPIKKHNDLSFNQSLNLRHNSSKKLYGRNKSQSSVYGSNRYFKKMS